MIHAIKAWLGRRQATLHEAVQALFGSTREEWLHRVADRVFLLRGRMARLHWPGRQGVARFRLPHVNWRGLVTGASLWRVVRRYHRPLATVGLVVAIASGGFRIIGAVRANPPKAEPPKTVNVWYLDMGTGKLYVVPSNSPLPMKAPSGAPGPNDTLGGVRAHVFACHSCADANDRFIGYLETADTPPDTGGKPAPVIPGMTASAHFVARPDDADTWYPATSPDGLSVANAAQTHCGRDQAPKYCTP